MMQHQERRVIVVGELKAQKRPFEWAGRSHYNLLLPHNATQTLARQFCFWSLFFACDRIHC
jgi:hypothetical protein